MGSRKATIEEIRALVEKEGCKLISNEYINSGTKLDMRCECGDIFKVNMEKFKARQNRCNKCSFNRKEKKRSEKYERKVREFVEENSTCKFISLNKGIKESVKLICNCGVIFDVTYSNFKNHNKRACNNCSKENMRNNNLSKRINSVKEVLSRYKCKWIDYEYKNQMSKLKLECECGNIFERKYYRLICDENSRKCNECSDAMLFKISEIREYIESNSGCTFIDNRRYINKDQKIKILCSCGNEFYKTYFDFKRSENKCCNECSGIKIYSMDEVGDFIENNSTCRLISNTYNNMYDKLTIECGCGSQFKTTFGLFKFANKRQCNKCGYNISASKNRLKYNDVKLRVESMGLKLLSNTYIKTTCGIEMECVCGRHFKKNLSSMYNKINRCPICSRSRGELKIVEYLENKQIRFLAQKQFSDCRGKKKPLLFDFELYLQGNSILIEYDGEQHYRPVSFNGSSNMCANELYERNKLYDQIKNEYCRKNNIPLIRIPYWDFDNIEKILDRELSKYKEFEEVV